MIKELADLLPNWPGAANQCRCFNHTINLVAKLFLKQFDVPKKQAYTALDAADALRECDNKELINLAEGLDEEEDEMVAGYADGTDIPDDIELENENEWIDELALMGDNEREELEQSMHPVKLVLVKVSENSWWMIYH